MSPAEVEFEQLIKRYTQAKKYERTKYLNDTPEGKEWAEKEIKKLIDRMNELWNEMTEEERQRYVDLL